MSASRRNLYLLALTAFLPGGLAGTLTAGLLFFLNPQLPFEVIPVLRGAIFYGLLLGFASLLVLFPTAWKKRRKMHGVLSWGLSITLGLAAVLAWFHASYFSFYLPSGINRRLLKAAIWLTLAALICFYTALIHRLKNRPHGRRSQALYLVLSIASIYVVFERREAFKPQVGPNPRATTYQVSARPHLHVIGIDGATLDVILPLAEQGRLPFFKRMIDGGASGRMNSFEPIRRNTLWTTLATGKYPYQHGIVGDSSYTAAFLPEKDLTLLPAGIGFSTWGVFTSAKEIRSDRRKVLTLWEITSRLGISAGTLSWPLTSPSEEGVRIGLSEDFFQGEEENEAWPAEIAQRASLFRVRTDEIDPEDTSLFGSRPSTPALRALAGDVWREDVSLTMLDREPPIDALFQVLPGLGVVSERYFGGYSAVQLGGSQHPISEEASQLLSAYYMHLDLYLAKIWERIPEPRLLVVTSVYGMEKPNTLDEVLGFLKRQPPIQGKPGSDGVLMFYGEGIRAGSNLRSAQIVDVVPTLLYGLGFPVAQDLDGVVLTAAFDTGFLARQPLSFLPSYETFSVPERNFESP